MKIERKEYEAEIKSIDRENLIVEHWISTESVDRYGDVVRAKGMQVRGKPVVLLGHGHDHLGREPIAKPLGFDKKAEFKGVPGILATTQFYPDDTGKRLFQKNIDGYMSSWSIGFLPIRTRPMKDEQGNETRGREILDWELLEYSLVAVPAQSDAQTRPGGKKEGGIGEITFKVYAHGTEQAEAKCATCGEICQVDIDQEKRVGTVHACEACKIVDGDPTAEEPEGTIADPSDPNVGLTNWMDKLSTVVLDIGETVARLEKRIEELAEKGTAPAVPEKEGDKTNTPGSEQGVAALSGEETVRLIAQVVRQATEEKVRHEINKMRGKVH